MTHLLGAVYSQIYSVSLEACLLQFLDPRCLDIRTITENYTNLCKLKEKIFPALLKQNSIQTTNLSLELEHLIENLLAVFKKMISSYTAFTRDCDVNMYFQKMLLHGDGGCEMTHLLKFYGDDVVNLHMNIINDIEIFLKRLNSVFYCVPATQGIACLKDIGQFLKHLRGISPIPETYLYSQDVACVKCLNEIMMLPNQGESTRVSLNNITCNHVTFSVPGEHVRGLFENELKQRGVPMQPLQATPNIEENIEIPSLKHGESLDEMHPALVRYSVFEHIPSAIAELSNLIYWDSLKSKEEHKKASCSQLAELLTQEALLQNTRKELDISIHGHALHHFFDDIHIPSLEKIFCGSVFNGIEDVIEALKNDCSSVFLEQKQYKYMSFNRDEVYNSLVGRMKAMHKAKNSKGLKDGEQPSHQPTEKLNMIPKSEEDIIYDACHRKQTYLKQLADDGIAKLHNCLTKQGETLYNMLNLRVWGDVIYAHLSMLMNHFLFRHAFAADTLWENKTVPSSEMFENSKYIKSTLFSQTLSNEHLHDLTMEFYKLINGPIAYNGGIFPQPENVVLAKAFECAGILPHQKLKLTAMLWPGIKPKDWIETEFNNFYHIPKMCLQLAQEKIWSYIRELVLSVSLYNNIFGQELCIYSASLYHPKQEKLVDGIYVTYESHCPLILINKSRGWIFKDLYALLYAHLQCLSQ